MILLLGFKGTSASCISRYKSEMIFKESSESLCTISLEYHLIGESSINRGGHLRCDREVLCTYRPESAAPSVCVCNRAATRDDLLRIRNALGPFVGCRGKGCLTESQWRTQTVGKCDILPLALQSRGPIFGSNYQALSLSSENKEIASPGRPVLQAPI